MTDIVTRALADEIFLSQLNARQWDDLVRQARQSGLLGRIAETVFRLKLENALPAGVRGHLDAERVLLIAQRASVWREINLIQQTLTRLDIPIIFLKGSAYLLADLPAASGRTFSDIDILLPPDKLPAAESALMLGGWMATHLDPYDQRYYRVWMHELPPFQHLRRQTVLDVHHAIMPLTARLRPDSALLRSAAHSIAGNEVLQVLCPADMVLHSMTHLLHNEEFSHGLRDLSDLDLLLRHFSEQENFWIDLQTRAEALTLTRPLFYGLRYTRKLLGTPIPSAVVQRATRSGSPPSALLPLMDWLWNRTLCSAHPRAADLFSPAAQFLLYLRAHWLKMPLWLLLPHLVRKTFRKRHDRPATTAAEQA